MKNTIRTVSLLAAFAMSCTQSGPAQPGSGGTSGRGGSGGTSAFGGTTSAGGNSGTGGATGNGGSLASGGVNSSAGAGGSTAGGATNGGGGLASGGTSSSAGGATGKGGAAGGTSAAGGAAGTSKGGSTGNGGAGTSGSTGSGGGPGDGGNAAGAGGSNATDGGGAMSAGAGGSGKGDGTGSGGTGPGGTSGTAAGGNGAGGTTAGGTGAGGSTACAAPSGPPTATPIQFNDNGAWCWYQDERALVDTKANKLLIGSVASGGSRNGYIEAVVYDLAGGSKKLFTVSKSLTGSIDDHNAPAFVIRPDGNYVAQYCGHRVDCITRFSIFDGSAWSAEKTFDWAPDGCPWAGASTNMVTYSNPWYIGSSIFSPVRSVGTDPAVLTSADDGQTWSYYGRLMSTKQTGYVAGYFKYWGDNTGRVDFVGTEAHPRDADTSLYHGYIQDGKVYNSTGTVMDSSLKDTSATSSNSVDINTYTPVFKTGSSVNGTKLCRMWNHDIVRYADGTVAILGQGRADNCT